MAPQARLKNREKKQFVLRQIAKESKLIRWRWEYTNIVNFYKFSKNMFTYITSSNFQDQFSC